MNRSIGLPIASVVIGLGAALMTMPDNILPPGAIRTSAVLFAIGLVFPSVVSLIRGGVEEILHTEWTVVYGIVYFALLDVIQGLYALDVPRSAVQGVFLAITLFVIALWAGVGQAPFKLPVSVVNSSATPMTTQFLLRLTQSCFVLGIFYFAFMSSFSLSRMLGGLTGNRWAAPWARGQLGDWYSIIEQLQYFGYLLPTLTVMMAVQEGKFITRRTLQGSLLTIGFLVFVLQGGSRRIFGMLIGGAVFTWLCSVRKRLRLQHVMVLLVIVGVSLVIMDGMLASRNKGVAQYSYSLDEFQSVRVDDNFLRFAQIIDFIPALYPHPGFEWLLYMVGRPIPRVLWPDKPITPGFDLSEVTGITASLSCSSLGEWYEAFGWTGLAVAGYGYGRLARWWHQVLEGAQTVSAIAVYSVGLMAIAVSMRSTIELILMSIPLVALLLLLHFVKRSAAGKKMALDHRLQHAG